MAPYVAVLREASHLPLGQVIFEKISLSATDMNMNFDGGTTQEPQSKKVSKLS